MHSLHKNIFVLTGIWLHSMSIAAPVNHKCQLKSEGRLEPVQKKIINLQGNQHLVAPQKCGDLK
jgi:hypothetical protein